MKTKACLIPLLALPYRADAAAQSEGRLPSPAEVVAAESSRPKEDETVKIDPCEVRTATDTGYGVLNSNSITLNLLNDPVNEWTPNSSCGGHAFGFIPDPTDLKTRATRFAEFLAARETVLPRIKEYSPVEHVTADDQPVYLIYSGPPALDAR